jgi:hypothetical protein
LAQIASQRTGGYEIVHLCEISGEVSGASGAGIMVLSDESVRGSLGTTDGVSAYLDDLQYMLGEGPAIDAHSKGKVILEPEFGSSRWPALAPSAVRAGVQALFGFPIRIGAVRIGALTLYRDRPGPLEEHQYGDALAMADLAAHTILAMQAAAPLGRVAPELQIGSNFHFVVHQAAGMTSVQLGISVTEALIRLRSYAFRSDRSIDEVSADVVDRRHRIQASE